MCFFVIFYVAKRVIVFIFFCLFWKQAAFRLLYLIHDLLLDIFSIQKKIFQIKDRLFFGIYL